MIGDEEAARRFCAARIDAQGMARLERLAVLLADFHQLPGVTPLALLHEQCPHHPETALVRRFRTEDEAVAFREMARSADFTLVIAPESNDLLVARCRWVWQ